MGREREKSEKKAIERKNKKREIEREMKESVKKGGKMEREK